MNLPRPWRQADREPRIGDLVLVPDGDGVPYETIDGPLLKDGDASTVPPTPGKPFWRCAPLSRRADPAHVGERYGRDYAQADLVVVEHPLGWHAARTYDRSLGDSLCLGDVDVFRLREMVASYIDHMAATKKSVAVEWRALAKMARQSDLLLRMLEGIPPLPEDEYRAKRSLRLALTEGRTSRLYGSLEAFPEHPLTRAIEEAEGGDTMSEQDQPQQAPQEGQTGQEGGQQAPDQGGQQEGNQQPAQPAQGDQAGQQA